MAFCKVCDCGNKIVFQRRLAFPIECPYCGRDTRTFETYNEDDPAVEVRLSQLRGLAADGEAKQGQSGGPEAASGDTPSDRESAPSGGRTASDGPGVSPAGSGIITSGETDLGSSHVSYCLKLFNGTVIPIPDEGCIIGRTANGGEELAEYGSVSRQHVRITPRRHSGVLVEDLSTYGTWVNGKKLEKNMPERATAGSQIMLCNLETTLEYR